MTTDTATTSGSPAAMAPAARGNFFNTIFAAAWMAILLGLIVQLAIFGANGPLSNPPTNFIYVRYARLAFYKTAPGPVSVTPSEVNVEVVRNNPAMDQIVGPNPKVFKLAEGFMFTEGPIWINKDGGYLLFSDPNANTIYKYIPNQDGKLEVFRTPS